MAESLESAMKTLNPLLGKCSPAGSSTTAQRLEEWIPEAHGLSTSSSTLKENYSETNTEGSCKTGRDAREESWAVSSLLGTAGP